MNRFAMWFFILYVIPSFDAFTLVPAGDGVGLCAVER